MIKTIALLPFLMAVFLLNSVTSFAAFPAHPSTSTMVKTGIPQDTGTEKRKVITKQSNGFGIGSLTCAILAFPLYVLGSFDGPWLSGAAFISQYHILAAILAAAAVTFGIIGINKRLKGLAIAGLALSLSTLIPLVLFDVMDKP